MAANDITQTERKKKMEERRKGDGTHRGKKGRRGKERKASVIIAAHTNIFKTEFFLLHHEIIDDNRPLISCITTTGENKEVLFFKCAVWLST